MNDVPNEVSRHSRDHFLLSLQVDFPVDKRPFQKIGERYGITEREVIDRIYKYKEEGLIRAFGPVFDPEKLGYVSTLVAAQVNRDRLPELAAAMLGIHEITHNYLRDHEWNVWFTMTAPTRDALETILKWIIKFPGVKAAMNLPVKRVFKINATWGIDDWKPYGQPGESPHRLDASQKDLVRALQQDFPILDHPFRLIAGSIGWNQGAVLETVGAWLENGTIRRFGARLNHRKIGYLQNLLTVWSGDQIERWGEKFAHLNNVSHCYIRETYQNWPYTLYAMTHAQTEAEMRRILTSMKRIAVGGQAVQLKTIYELKKTTMKYFQEE